MTLLNLQGGSMQNVTEKLKKIMFNEGENDPIF